MKICIDSNEAKVTSLAKFFQVPEIKGSKVWLPIAVESQKKSRWCWAALTSAIVQYYKGVGLAQSTIVDNLLTDFRDDDDDDDDRYSKDDIDNQNINFNLDVALKEVDCFSHWTIGKPSFERIQFEINQGRPFGVRLEWFRGGAHYVLIKGYDTTDKILIIEDSLHGASRQEYKEFPEKYKESGAVWTETFWTKN